MPDDWSDLSLDSRRRKTSVQPEPHQSCRNQMASHPESRESLPEKLPQSWPRSTCHHRRQERCGEIGERGPGEASVQEGRALQPCQSQAHLPHQHPLQATGAYPCELHHATPRVKQHPVPPNSMAFEGTDPARRSYSNLSKKSQQQWRNVPQQRSS